MNYQALEEASFQCYPDFPQDGWTETHFEALIIKPVFNLNDRLAGFELWIRGKSLTGGDKYREYRYMSFLTYSQVVWFLRNSTRILTPDPGGGPASEDRPENQNPYKRHYKRQPSN